MDAGGRSEAEDLHDAYAEGEARLAFGRRRGDGRIVHISEVVSGLACACGCPACAKDLVAKRGELNEHHFAHHVAGDCRSGPETAMHAFAKQLLDEKLWMVIPKIEAAVGARSKTRSEAQRYEFDGAVLEQRLGDIVPDVILKKGGSELLVEILVTHRCDARKRQRIRELGISAVEIDLSKLRGASKDKLSKAVLETAPREWLFNRRIVRMEAELRAEEEAAAERRRQAEERRLAPLRRSVAAARAALPAGPIPGDFLQRVQAKGLEGALGIELPGDFCFAVERAHWQAALLDVCVLPLDDPARRRHHGFDSFKTKDAFKSVKALLHEGLIDFIDDETEKRLQESEPAFVRPYMVVVAYLEALREKGFLREAFDWAVARRLEQAWEERRERDEKRTRRSSETLDAARAIVAKVPEADRRNFDLDVWYRRVQPAFGCSFADCIETDDARFGEMDAALAAVDAMVRRGGPIVEELLDLPLAAEVQRQVLAREAKAQERNRQKEEAARLAAEERVRRITFASIDLLETSAWAETPNAAFGGATPQDHARASSDRLDEALREAAAERRMRQARVDAAALADMKRSQLVDAVHRKLPSARAEVFLHSTQPKLGHRHPIDYCVDERTLEACLSLLGGASSGR